MLKWRENGERLILLVDGNEDLTKHHLGTALRTKLNMVDLVEERTGVSGPATFCQGSEKIDGAFAIRDIECTGDRFLPLRDWPWLSPRNHHIYHLPLPDEKGETGG